MEKLRLWQKGGRCRAWGLSSETSCDWDSMSFSKRMFPLRW